MSRCARSPFVLAALLIALATLLTGSLISQDKPSATLFDDDATRNAILKALEQKTECSFKETPLSEALQSLAKKHRFQVVFDEKALADAGVETTKAITRSIKAIRLRAALNLILDDLKLAWIIRDEALVVTSADVAAAHLEPRIYPVADLVMGVNSHGVLVENEGSEDNAKLIDLITSIVAPESWTEQGGPGSVKPLRRSLVIDQNGRQPFANTMSIRWRKTGNTATEGRKRRRAICGGKTL